MTTTLSHAPGDPAEIYNADYYQCKCGPVPYSRGTSAIMNFFSTVVATLTRSLNPKTVLDAGCAFGMLVELFRDWGVEAWGIDISAYALSQVRADIQPYCSVGSLADPIEGRYDLITCIEVLEHIPEPAALLAIKNLTQATDTILFSSSPTDLGESTHVTVRQPMWWLSRFADHGFYPDLVFDSSFVTPQAMLLRRSEPVSYEVLRLFSNMIRCQIRAVGAEGRIAELTNTIHRIEEPLAALQTQVAATEQALAAAQAQVAAMSEERTHLSTQLAQQVDQLGSSQQRIEAAEEQVRHFSTTAEQMEQALTAARERAATMDGEISRLSAEVQQLNQQTTLQTAEIKKWEERAMAGQEQIEQLNAESRSVEEELQAAQSAAAQRNLELVRLLMVSDPLNSQLPLPELQLAEIENQMRKLVSSEHERQRLSVELTATQQALVSLSAHYSEIETRAETTALEVTRARELAERAEQRNSILLQQIEQAVGALAEMREMVALQNSRLDNHISSQKAASSSLQSRCNQIATAVQQKESQLAQTKEHVEEINRQSAALQQQVYDLTVAAQQREPQLAQTQGFVEEISRQSTVLQQQVRGLTLAVQQQEPQLAETQERVEELTRLNVALHQQLHNFSMQLRGILESRMWKTFINARTTFRKVVGPKS